MAEFKLVLTTDTSQSTSEIEKLGVAVQELGTTSKKTSEQQAKGFKDIADSAEKVNKTIGDSKPTVNIGKQVSELSKLKQEIKKLTSEALAAGEGTQKFAQRLQEAANKKADLKDLQQAISALDPDTKLNAIIGIAGGIAGGFAAAQGALALFGEESEDVQKALLKVQAALSIAQGIQQIKGLGDNFRILQVQIQNSEAAQKAFNLVARANPALLLVTAVAALGVALSALDSDIESNTEEFKKNNETIKELTETRKQLESSIKDLQIQLQLETGAITENEAEKLRIQNKAGEKRIEIEKKTNEGLQKENEFSLSKAIDITTDLLSGQTTAIEEETAKRLSIIQNSNAAIETLDKETKLQLQIADAKETQRKAKEAEDKKKKDEEDFKNFLNAKRKQKEEEEKLDEEAARNTLAILDEQVAESERVNKEELQLQEEFNKKQEDLRQKNFEDFVKKNQEEQALKDEFLLTDFEKQVRALEEQRAAANANDLIIGEERLRINEEIERRISELKAQQLEQQLSAISNQLNAITALERAFGAETKAGATAQALINTYVAATRALREFPPPFSFVAAAVQTAAGLANVAKINNIQFYKGGYTGDGGKYEEAGTVHKSEFVFNQEKTKKNRRLFEAIHTDNYSGLRFGDIQNLLKGTGVSIDREVPNKMFISTIQKNEQNSVQRNNELKELKAIKEEIANFKKGFMSSEKQTNSDGKIIIKKGSTRRISKK